MARKYSIAGFDINTASTTIVSLNATTTSRPMIYDLTVGSNATPADNACVHALRRFSTTNGTGTALTPAALDPANPAAVHAASRAHTVEPSYSSSADVL